MRGLGPKTRRAAEEERLYLIGPRRREKHKPNRGHWNHAYSLLVLHSTLHPQPKWYCKVRQNEKVMMSAWATLESTHVVATKHLHQHQVVSRHLWHSRPQAERHHCLMLLLKLNCPLLVAFYEELRHNEFSTVAEVWAIPFPAGVA